MKRIFVLFLIGLNSWCIAQNDEIVVTIGKNEITFGEIMYAYQKNRDTSEAIAYDSLRDYLEQYVDFKLRVTEAYALGMHQEPNFQEELKSYIDQVKKPYLENPNLEESKLKSIYNRYKWELNASHILLKVDPMASPKDTIAAYQKLDSIRTLAQSTKTFAELAKANSQDGSARKGGELGWFTAFHMVAPFEDAAYGLEVGDVSKVFRTRFGYHIMILNDKRPSKGRVRSSHIYFAKSIHGSELAKQKAKMYYDSIQAGADWDLIAKRHSDDKNSSRNGGMLPLAGVKQLPDDFFSEIYKLDSIGETSLPFETSSGWHIARLEEIEPLFEFEFKKKEITYLLERSGRNEFSQSEVIDYLKSQPSYIQNTEFLNARFSSADIDAQKLEKETAFEYEQVKVSWNDFLKSPEKGQNDLSSRDAYKQFEGRRIIEIEEGLATTKYPEYGYLLKEFEEGLLLFEIMQLEIWEPSGENTKGIEEYYQTNIHLYKGLELTGQDVKAESKVLSNLFDKVKDTNVLDRGKLVSEFSGVELKIAKSTRMAREIPNFDSSNLSPNRWIRTDEKTLMFVEGINEIVLPFEACRGQVLADYQDYLTEEWIKNLRDQYKIKINEKKLKQLVTR